MFVTHTYEDALARTMHQQLILQVIDELPEYVQDPTTLKPETEQQLRDCEQELLAHVDHLMQESASDPEAV
jgi:hypothetical protein